MLKITRFSRNRRTVLKYLSVLVPAAVTFPGLMAFAQDSGPLDAPRNEGLVGEGDDGFAIPRDGAGADIEALVEEINAQRRLFYQSKADEQGVDITAIQDIYATAIYDNAPVGWWFWTDSGWIQK